MVQRAMMAQGQAMYGTIDNLPTSTLCDADSVTVVSATTTSSTSSTTDRLSRRLTAPPRTLVTLNRALADQRRKQFLETPDHDLKLRSMRLPFPQHIEPLLMP